MYYLAYSSDGRVTTSEQIAAAFANMVHKEQVVTSKIMDKKSQNDGGEVVPVDTALPAFLDMDVNDLLDQMSSQAMDGCIDLLQQMNVRDTEGESE